MTTRVSDLTRRWFLGGLLAGAGTPVLAEPLARSLRPMPRPDGAARVTPAELLVARAGLGGKIGYVVADAETGEPLEVLNPLLGLPPASVTKSATALYALDALGAGHRFVTQVLARGPVTEGRLDGDLVLAGSGDPVLDTDMLGGLVEQLAEAGLREVTGRFLFHAGALPRLPLIDPDQPAHVGYNPAISGLNLNFNRVHFEWKRAGTGYDVTMDARARLYAPPVSVARMQVVDRSGPVYTYSSKGGVDEWTVAEGALGKEGARWLPVRRPALYCAEVFHTLAGSAGIALPRPVEVPDLPPGAVMARHDSAPLTEILRGMLKYSTNMTAEAVGLSATIARGGRPLSLAESAEAMSAWMAERTGARKAMFVDHSGLGDASRLSAVEMARMLVQVAPEDTLRGLMKQIYLRDEKGRPLYDHPVEIRAKTGTLNFVSALAGYITPPAGRPMAFAIFTADEDRRAALSPQDLERPPGGKSWINRSKRLQSALIERWIALYAGA